MKFIVAVLLLTTASVGLAQEAPEPVDAVVTTTNTGWTFAGGTNQPSDPVDAAVIHAHPAPVVQPLFAQDRMLYDRIYKRVEGPLRFYDAPGGNLVADYGVGFTFVTLSGVREGEWEQTGPNRWVRASSLTDRARVSRFAGVLLPAEPLPFQMAWTLRHIQPSLRPGEDDNPNAERLLRYTRVNIFSTTIVDGKRWYQIGVDQWVHQYNVAKASIIERPEGINTEKWISIDLFEQTLVAYVGTLPVFATLIASGLPHWPTNEGLFNVYFRRERTVMDGAHDTPYFWYLEDVPWTMFFDGDIGLHGVYWHDGFGFRRSRGCVNMSVTDAEWLYRWSADVRDPANPDSKDLAVFVFSSDKFD